MELRTRRLLLREMSPSDVPAVHAYASDPAVCRYTDWGPNSLEETTAVVQGWTEAVRGRERSSWTLAITTAVGLVGAIELRIEDGRGTIGFDLRRSAWGQGYASEAADAMLTWAFTDGGATIVEATCRPDNLGSARVLTRIGMQQVGHLKAHIWIRDHWADSLLFRIDYAGHGGTRSA